MHYSACSKNPTLALELPDISSYIMITHKPLEYIDTYTSSTQSVEI